ncbi:MAG TPA: SDR family NAD(P)-dependent oxidoreductase, partial [Microbacteriaceae bacterium]|nr:SDR family NAD(P)-dependent oxidoreductase [Microbacteriaceae bacterium]
MTDSPDAFLARSFGLTGRRALVTGGSSGIGRAIAFGLAQAGADVIIAARTSARLETAIREGHDLGVSLSALEADVAQAENRARLLEGAGAVDILVNAAGVNIRPPL